MTSALLLTAALAALWPWLLGFRAFGYLLRTAYPSMAQKLERLLPIALPRRTAIPTPLPTDPSLRVAVIGGGIAGAGCAFSIQNSRAGRVTLYEAAPALGGNAKVFDWSVQSRIVRTGLSVLAWPAYFHNYMALLEKLRVGTTSVRLPFAVQPGGSEDALYLQDDPLCAARYSRDLAAFSRVVVLAQVVQLVLDLPARLCEWVRAVACCSRRPFANAAPSVYTFQFLNPLNLISLRTLCILFGMRARFWNTIAMPIWSSTFLSASLSGVPASIAPVLSDIMPLHGIVELETWRGDSSEVFTRMTAGVDVRVSSPVESVCVNSDGTITITAKHNNATTVQVVDRVVFACSAPAVTRLLTPNRFCSFRLERAVLGGVTFAEPADTTFISGVVHSDATVLPPSHATELLSRYSNFVKVLDAGDHPAGRHQPRIENTFILSSWCPPATAIGPSRSPMLVSYGLAPGASGVRAGVGAVGTVDNREAHPELALHNQIRALLCGLLFQGRAGMYYAGSSVCLANGHDLSLLSGLVVAGAMGARYPFAHNPAALADYRRLATLMNVSH